MLYPSLVWRMPAKLKELYLTFDDGPIAGPTEFALDVLKQYQAKATFFCIGDNIKKHPEVFQQIIGQGHSIGNHTYNHLNGWKTSSQRYLDNVQQCQQEITNNLSPEYQSSNAKPKILFRPPYGRITRQQIAALDDYRIIMWDVLSADYNQRLSSEKCLHHTIRATRPGSIIVFHDSFKAARNMTFALPRYIEYFSEKGFVFKSL